VGPSEFPGPFAEWQRKPIVFVSYGVSEVRHGAEPRRDKCERCHKVFLTGHQTGRRSQGKYCGAGCRVAAMRERNAACG